MGKYCDGITHVECDGVYDICETCDSCYCYCDCPCPHDDQEIFEGSDSLMYWICSDCDKQLSGFIGQFGFLFKESN